MVNKELISKYIKIAEEKGIEKRKRKAETKAGEKAEKKIEETKENEKETPEEKFKVIFSDDRDFIIEKRLESGKVEQLVFLYPQFFIRKSNGIAVEITSKSLNSFFEKGIFEKGTVEINNNLIGVINANSAIGLKEYFDTPDYVDFFEERKASINFFDNIQMHNNRYGRLSRDFLFNVAKYNQVLVGNQKYDWSFLMIAAVMYERSFELFKAFMEKYIRSSMTGINLTSGGKSRYSSEFIERYEVVVMVNRLYEKYGTRFLDYLLFELYRQGYSEAPIGLYSIYLKSNLASDDFPVNLWKCKRMMTWADWINHNFDGKGTDKFYISSPRTFEELSDALKRMKYFAADVVFFVRDRKTDKIVSLVIWNTRSRDPERNFVAEGGEIKTGKDEEALLKVLVA